MPQPAKQWNRQFPWLSLVFITALGAGLRAWQLGSHPLWSDEFATLVFSLGHGFKSIPLDEMVSGSHLLESLTVQGDLGPGATLNRLLTESNHPPLYFLLSNLWIRFWQAPGQLVDLGVARSLPALFGIIAIPSTYALTRLAVPQKSTLDAPQTALPLVAAFLMAVSPFGVYLSQETRHYTLALLWAIASLACWTLFLRHWSQRSQSPRWLPWAWILVNGLGITTHFFMGLLLLAQGIALGIMVLHLGLPRPREQWTLGIVLAGTGAIAAAWIPYAQNISKEGLTDWLLETATWIAPMVTGHARAPQIAGARTQG
ncbi:MAG: hypothetical protein AAF889_14385, partial [Cyanobacteria bacterium P01_D01_bin.73]